MDMIAHDDDIFDLHAEFIRQVSDEAEDLALLP